MKRFRVYADTSVFGGCFDDEFAEERKRFFNAIGEGSFTLLVSATTLAELQEAPEKVRQVLAKLPPDAVEVLEFSQEIARLRDAYLAAGILKPENKSDAEHIASASVADCDFVVSWNFRHIVNFEKITKYQAVNLMNGIGKFVFILQKKWLKAMKNKKFDCVKMKWDIQRRIAEDFASVSDEEAHRIQMERVISDPILGPFCKEVGSAKKPSSK